MQKRIRLGILVSHPVQYFSPWFRDLARTVDIKVLYVHRQTRQGQADAGFGEEFEWDVPLLDGYEHEWLENEARNPGVDRFFGCDVPTLEKVIDSEKLNALLVFGWRHKSSWQAYRACRRLGVPILMKGDSSFHAPRSLVRRAVKRLLYGFLLPRFDGHLYIGQANRLYLEHYGVRARQLYFSPLTVDRAWFAEMAFEAEQGKKPARLRVEMGIEPESFVYLFVGKFTNVKRPDMFLQAFLKLRELDSNATVDAVLIGGGPLQGMLEEIRSHDPDHIHLAGFKNQTELPAFYRMADSLVLPGYDSWGLVVNEAAACGIPALVSDRVGCAPDLVTPGETGFVFKHESIDDLARCMFEIRRCMRANRLAIEQNLAQRCAVFSQESATLGLQSALDHLVGTGRQAGNAERKTEREPKETASTSTANHRSRAQGRKRSAC